MKIQDVKKMKKLLCVLLAGTVILGEAGSASSVLAAETEIGTELTAEPAAAEGTEEEADAPEAASEDKTGETETQPAEETGGAVTGEQEGAENPAEETGGVEETGTADTEAAGAAEITGNTENGTESAEGAELEEAEEVEGTNTEETEAVEGTNTEETGNTENGSESVEGSETEETKAVEGSETEETETEETEAVEGSETEETEAAEETETEEAEQSRKKVTKDEDGLKKDTVTPGTSYDDALEISLNSSVTATIQKNLLITEKEHWYKFTVTMPGMVSVSFQHEKIDSSANTTAWKIGLDAQKSGSATVTKNSKANDTLVKTAALGLAAGTYYIQVSGEMITSEGDSYVMTLNYAEGACELESNDSLAKANDLTAGTTINGSIYGLSDVADCYKVTTTEAGYLQVSFSHDMITGKETADVYSVNVLDKDGESIMTKNSQGGEISIATPKLGLAAGTYYIQITPAFDVTGITGGTDTFEKVYETTYQLKADFTASNSWEQEKNDSYSTAKQFASSGQEYSGTLHKSSDVDYYKVEMKEAGYLQATFSHDMISGKETTNVYTVSVLDQKGNSMVSKNSKGGDASVVTPKLGVPAGIYYIKVTKAVDLTNLTDTSSSEKVYETVYQLKATFKASSSWEQESNDSYSTAKEFPSSGKKYSGTIHKSGDVDYYKVEMKEAGYLQATFTHDVISGKESTEVYTISVLDAKGNSILTTTSKGGDASVATPKYGAPKGTYYIKIAAAVDLSTIIDSGVNEKVNDNEKVYETVYQLKATFKASSTWEQESNDSYSTANTITSGQKYSGSIHKSGDVDWYKIEMKKAGYLQAKLTHGNVSNSNVILNLQVYNADQNQVGETLSSNGAQTSEKTTKIGLSAGTYYIAVKDNSTDLYKSDFFGTYGLTVTTKTASGWETESNGSSSTADSLTIGKTITGVSHTTADYDWFQFTLSKSAYVNFSLTHSKIESDDMAWYVTLMDKEGKRYSYKESGYIYAYGGTTYAESTPVKLPAGKYYIRVQAGGNAGVGKEYKLAVNKVTTAKPVITGVKSTAYNKLKVSWNRVPGAEKYYVYRSTSKNGTYEKVKTIQSGTTASWTDATVTTGKTYYYKIKAVVKTDKSRTTSASAVKSGKAVPAATTLKASASSKQIKLTWSKVTGANGYVIYRSTSKDGTYKKVKTITKGSTKTYTNSKLTTGKTYYYKIRAYRTVNGKNVYGDYSEVVSAQVK